MCRWLAYSGNPVRLDSLLLEPEHSLIDQSLHSTFSETTTNGDGFGVGWYGELTEPGLFKDVRPAWNDPNLREVARHLRARVLLAHVRAAGPDSHVQRSNCHPFSWGRWLFMHNGAIREFRSLHRDLALAVREDLYPCIQGTTDSEIMFYLAISFGLVDDAVAAVERMVGFVEETAARRDIAEPLQMTLCLSDGDRLLAFRYASRGEPRSLFVARDLDCLAELGPAAELFAPDARVIVSEPFGGVSDAWHEVPPSSAVVVTAGRVEHLAFNPRSLA